MALTINVRGGTPRKHDGRRLCDSCKHGLVSKSRGGEDIVGCNWGYLGRLRVLEMSVVECSGYRNITEKSLMELQNITWILETKAGKVVGFKPPTKKD